MTKYYYKCTSKNAHWNESDEVIVQKAVKCAATTKKCRAHVNPSTITQTKPENCSIYKQATVNNRKLTSFFTSKTARINTQDTSATLSPQLGGSVGVVPVSNPVTSPFMSFGGAGGNFVVQSAPPNSKSNILLDNNDDNSSKKRSVAVFKKENGSSVIDSEEDDDENYESYKSDQEGSVLKKRRQRKEIVNASASSSVTTTVTNPKSDDNDEIQGLDKNITLASPNIKYLPKPRPPSALALSGEAKSQNDLRCIFIQKSYFFLRRDGIFGPYVKPTEKCDAAESVEEPGVVKGVGYLKIVDTNVIIGRDEFFYGFNGSAYYVNSGSVGAGQMTFPDFIIQVSGKVYSIELKCATTDFSTFLSTAFYGLDKAYFGGDSEHESRTVEMEIKQRSIICSDIPIRLVFDIRLSATKPFEALMVIVRHVKSKNNKGFWDLIHSVQFFCKGDKLSKAYVIKDIFINFADSMKKSWPKEIGYLI